MLSLELGLPSRVGLDHMHIINEHYHVYNRGAHKAPIFLDGADYQRFLDLLYVANDKNHTTYNKYKPREMYIRPRVGLVDIKAYCLMPNHFHIALQEKTEGGTYKFMLKLCTAYSMYYNYKYDHPGTIFQGQYKSKHVDTDEYFRYLIQYIHLNPYSVEEPHMMKAVKPEHLEEAILCSRKYIYSSFKDHLGENRIQSTIIARPTLDAV